MDARAIASEVVIETEVCIIGGGAAGITIAKELAGSNFRVCLLESGGLEFDEQSQDLYKGSIAGRKYYDLDICRLRYFGGTTNHWSGWCRPLEAVDFERRAWIPYTGWPFPRNELERYYHRAYRIVQLPSNGHSEEVLADERSNSWPAGDRIATVTTQFSPPTRFGDVYRSELTYAPNVFIYLNANVIEIELKNNAQEVAGLKIATFARNIFSVSARHYILAAGGLENARLLLASRRTQSSGIGNGNDLVGRFFMDHMEPPVGIFLPSRPDDPRWTLFDAVNKEASRQPLRLMSLHSAVQQREQILNCCVALVPERPEGEKAARRIVRALTKGQVPDELGSDLYSIITDLDGIANEAYGRLIGRVRPVMFELHSLAQQTPNPDSSVSSHRRINLPYAQLSIESANGLLR